MSASAPAAPVMASRRALRQFRRPRRLGTAGCAAYALLGYRRGAGGEWVSTGTYVGISVRPERRMLQHLEWDGALYRMFAAGSERVLASVTWLPTRADAAWLERWLYDALSARGMRLHNRTRPADPSLPWRAKHVTQRNVDALTTDTASTPSLVFTPRMCSSPPRPPTLWDDVVWVLRALGWGRRRRR